MARGLLHVPERHVSLEGGGDGGVADRVRADRLRDACPPGNPSHDPARTVAIGASSLRADEDRPAGATADGKIDRSGGARRKRDHDGLSDFALDGERAMTAFEAEGLDVRADRLGDPQALRREEQEQSVFTCWAEFRGDEQGTHLIAIGPAA